MEPRFAHDFSGVPASARSHAPHLTIVPAHDESEREADAASRRIPHAAPAWRAQAPDFSSVRVHTDGKAAESADAVQARAYTVGSDIVFGSGQYAPRSAAGQRLIAHELTHTMQQSSGVVSLQRDTIDDVRKKMSYSIGDWAIRDSEALESLALLGTIDPAQLPAELGRLGSKYVTRLLDNLPDSAKTGEIYKRVVDALGPTGVAPYAVTQLKRGLFDWAVTDEEVTRVFNVFSTLAVAQQEAFLANLNTSKWLGRLIDNSNHGHHLLYIIPWMKTMTKGALTPQQRDIFRVIVENSGKDAVDTLTLAAELRFDVTVGPSTIPNRTPVTTLDAGKLRETYLILDKLPEAHVAKNKELLALGQFTQPATALGNGQQQIVSGSYNAGLREFALNVADSGDIEEVVLHETGHAVDQEMGWSSSAEPASSKRGGWKAYAANHAACAQDMIDSSAGALKTKLSAPQQGDVAGEMAAAMRIRSDASLFTAIRALPWWNTVPAPDRRAAIDDPALTAVGVGLKQPYFLLPETGGEHLGSHVYQESYTPQWVRYEHAARDRKVSNYQFRDEGEWFAEAYYFYYQPDKRGIGMKLHDHDKDTKQYFDNHVHTRPASR